MGVKKMNKKSEDLSGTSPIDSSFPSEDGVGLTNLLGMSNSELVVHHKKVKKIILENQRKLRELDELKKKSANVKGESISI